MGSSTIDTPDSKMTARATANTTSSCGAGAIPSRMTDGATAPGSWVNALGTVVPKVMTVGALGVRAKA